MSRLSTITEHRPTAAGSPASAGAPAAASPAPPGGITGGILVLIGGVAGIVQLVLPWSSTAAGSTSGWGQYYNTAHHGAAQIIAAYAILVGALAGLVMLVAAIRLLMPHVDHRWPFAAATVAAVVAIVCAAWTLGVAAGPPAAHVTLGWYLFLLAGLFGLAGVALARAVLTLPSLLMLVGGAAALVQLVAPWFSAGDRAVTGWQQYYQVAHPTTSGMIAAYAILVAAIAGLVVLASAIAIAAGVGPVRALAGLALAASVVLLVCAAWWLAAGTPPQGSTLSFGWYLFLIAGLLGLLGALAQGAAGARLDVSSTLLILAGLGGLASLGLPWFSGTTGWGFYYRVAHHGFTEVGAAYAILLGVLAAIVLLLAGVAMLVRPGVQRGVARIARVAAIVALVCIAWWLILGPGAFADKVVSGGFGWYLFVLAGVLGLIGALAPLVNTTFDRVSFMVVFLGVPVVIFLVFVVSPFVQAIYYSMTDWGGFSATMNFIGFDNYVRLFGDDTFRRAVLNNIELGIVVPLVTIVLALAVASMVTVGGPSRGQIRGIRGSAVYRVVSFFPYTIPAIVIGLLWAQVYNPSAGILNGFLGLFGVEQINWLGDPGTAMPASMFVIIWSFIGFYSVLFVASIKGISAEIYEAARLDGAGRFRTAISVTVPLIRDTIQTAYIYIGIAALDAFVYMMALNPFGGPDYSTLTMSQDLYNTAFRKGEFGYATSMGVILAIVTLLFATIVFAVNRLTGGGGAATPRRKRRRPATVAIAAQPATTAQGAGL
jgi:N-acetylglucosamine transport system permease protein